MALCFPAALQLDQSYYCFALGALEIVVMRVGQYATFWGKKQDQTSQLQILLARGVRHVPSCIFQRQYPCSRDGVPIGFLL